jgi:hypothetical protein
MRCITLSRDVEERSERSTASDEDVAWDEAWESLWGRE